MVIVNTILKYIRKIKRIINFIPILWNTYDFDYHSSVDLFKYQLSRTADFFESKEANSLDIEKQASRIRMIIRLMDKVYNEDYEYEFIEQIEKIYGASRFESELGEVHPVHGQLYRLVEVWDKDYTEDELNKIKTHSKELHRLAREKQNRAHKLLWELIEHNIRYWWD